MSADAAALANPLHPCGFVGHPADVHPRAVVEEDLHRLGVVVGLAGHLRVDAARVVADHPAEAAMRVRRRLGPYVSFRPDFAAASRSSSQMSPGSTRAKRPCEVDLQHAMHVLRPVDDDGHVHHLPAEARAAGARDQRRAKARHAATVSTTSSFDLGMTTPIGTWR